MIIVKGNQSHIYQGKAKSHEPDNCRCRENIHLGTSTLEDKRIHEDAVLHREIIPETPPLCANHLKYMS
jgi:hypothetical protein